MLFFRFLYFNEVSLCPFRLLMLQCWERHHQSIPTVTSPWIDPRTAQDYNTNRLPVNPWHSGQQALPEKKPVHSFNTESYQVYRGPNGQQVIPGKRDALHRIVLDDNVDLSVLTAVLTAVQEQQDETRLRIRTLRSFQNPSRTNPKQKVTLVCLKR